MTHRIMLLHAVQFLFILAAFNVWKCSGNRASSNNTISSWDENADAREWGVTSEGFKGVVDQKHTVKFSEFGEIAVRTLAYGTKFMKFIAAYIKDHPLGAAIELVLAFTGEAEESVWDQVKDKVKKMVHDKIDKNNLGNLRSKWNVIDSAMKSTSKSTYIKECT